jgi:hypothetical protein
LRERVLLLFRLTLRTGACFSGFRFRLLPFDTLALAALPFLFRSGGRFARESFLLLSPEACIFLATATVRFRLSA